MTAAAPAPTTTTAPAPAAPSAAQVQAAERAAIDAAASGPVLFFLGNAVLWLLLATILGVISSIQLHSPDFLAHCPIFTYGRVLPAYNNAFAYGWATLSGMGVAIWLLARLCRVQIKLPGVLITGAIFWQVGLTLGIGQILAGKTTGVEGLEIPGSAAVLMLIGYMLVGLWGALLFGYRRQAPAYISVWYLVAALFWFPWMFGLAHLSLQLPGVTGVVQSLVAAWATQNFLHVFITAIGLAAAYYLIPKVIDRPIHSYNLASTGFWAFILFAGLTGAVRLSGGPLPAWLVTFSIAASILLIAQIATVSANLILTMRGQYHMVYHSPTIRFTFFGAIAFTIGSVIGLIAALRSVDRVLHFTLFQSAQTHLLLYAFFSMVMFGAIYYILPRLVGCEWLSSTMISWHFLASAYGGGMLIISLALGGIASGAALADPGMIFSQVIEEGARYHIGATLGWVMLGLGHAIFGFHFLLMLFRIGQPGGEPTLFAPIGEEKH
jgi:cytochrome c oxidase cbb3-type subunit 1